jgi:hypothetical protein
MQRYLALCSVFALLAAAPVRAGEVSPVQSEARPLGLDIYAPVQLTGSDARAQQFNEEALPYFLQLINQKLGERAVFNDREGFKLDASRLYLRTESDKPIRVYFVWEGAGYRNSLGFSMTPAGSQELGTQYLIFPDASFVGPTSSHRDATRPLVVGDFVELSTGGPGIQLDFFLAADGARSVRNVWYNNIDRNADDKQHVVAFLLPNSPYVMIGFEDLWNGGDLDYNDCLFVIDVGETNAQNLFDIAGSLPH